MVAKRSGLVRPEGDQRGQAKQCRSGAHDREVGPLALGFDAKMGAAFLERDLELPARDEPLEDIDRSGIEIAAEEGLQCKLSARIADQQPSDGHGGQAAVVPDRGAGGDLDETIGAAVPEATVWRCQTVLASCRTWLSVGRRLPLRARQESTALSARLPGWIV